MDRITEFVAVAHLKLRLEFYTRYPELFLEVTGMASQRLYIPSPIELAGMRSRLLRAKEQEKAIAATGKDYDDVQNGIDEAHEALKGHVSSLQGYEGELRRTILGMLERSNASPTDGGSNGRPSPSAEVKVEAERTEVGVEEVKAEAPPQDNQVVTEADVGPVDGVLAEPERLTVNGVSAG